MWPPAGHLVSKRTGRLARAAASAGHLRLGREPGHPSPMSSRFWVALLAALLIAALTYIVSRRVFGFAFLLLPVFLLWGRGPKDR
jgi:hypothetical protein